MEILEQELSELIEKLSNSEDFKVKRKICNQFTHLIGMSILFLTYWQKCSDITNVY